MPLTRPSLPLPSHLLYTVGSGFLLFFLLIVTMSLTGLSALEENNQRLARITDEVIEKTRHANLMRDTLRDRALTMHNIFITQDDFTREQLTQRFYQFGGTYLATRPKLEAYPLNAEEKAILERLDHLTLENQPLMIKIINLATSKQEKEALRLLQTEEFPRQQALVATLDDLIQAQQKITQQATLEADQTYTHTRTLMFILGLIALLLAVSIGALILKRIRRLASETERARTRYQTLFETNTEGIVILGRHGFIGCNPSALDMFGYPNEADFLALPPQYLGADPQPDGRTATEVATEFIAAAFVEGHAYMNWEAQRADGSHFPAEIALHAMRFEGEPTLQAIVRDLSLQKEAERALHAAHAAELAAATLKTQFIANISHEIRTPMNGVLGMADLLQRQPLTPTQANYVRAINDSAHTLLSVLNDLLDFSKLAAGRMTIEQVTFDLPALLTSTCQLPQHRAETAGLQFHLSLSDNLPRWVTGDPLRLRQILTNLIDNAIKFTPQGSVTLTVEYPDPDDHPQNLLFSITDTGIGIPDAARSDIFEAFIQADGSVSRHFGGTGLGLTICRDLAERMGGRLWLQAPLADQPDPTGSCFYLDIPLEAASPLDIAANHPDQDGHKTPLSYFNGARILIAEDHPVNQLLIREMLIQLGASPTLTRDGQAAFTAYGDAEGAFDLILMDYQMPGWDGVRATHEIRALEGREGLPRCPILALTAAALTDRQVTLADEWRNAGMDDLLEKPITSERLSAALAKWLTPESIAPLAGRPIPPTPLAQHPAALLEMFVDTTTTDLSRLIEHLEHEQHEEAIRLAHRICGAAAFIGATELADHARSLEKTLKEGVAHNESELNALHIQFSSLKKAIEARLKGPAHS